MLRCFEFLLFYYSTSLINDGKKSYSELRGNYRFSFQKISYRFFMSWNFYTFRRKTYLHFPTYHNTRGHSKEDQSRDYYASILNVPTNWSNDQFQKFDLKFCVLSFLLLKKISIFFLLPESYFVHCVLN